jgi:hypothetical protein
VLPEVFTPEDGLSTTVLPAIIRGLEHMTAAQLDYELGQGARFVHFQFCVSLLWVTFLRNSKIYFIHAGERTFSKSFGYTLLSLLFGWWAPWGPIYTVKAVWANAQGGEPADPVLVDAIRATLP